MKTLQELNAEIVKAATEDMKMIKEVLEAAGLPITGETVSVAAQRLDTQRLICGGVMGNMLNEAPFPLPPLMSMRNGRATPVPPDPNAEPPPPPMYCLNCGELTADHPTPTCETPG